MPKLVFYRQKRYDGAIRTGLELDDDPIAEHYEEGSGERDPALLWFVDLRCKGPGIPGDPDDAEGVAPGPFGYDPGRIRPIRRAGSGQASIWTFIR